MKKKEPVSVEQAQQVLMAAKAAEYQKAEQDIRAILDRVQGKLACLHAHDSGGGTSVQYKVVG